MAKIVPAALGIDAERALLLLRNMLLQRAVDTRGFQLNRQGKIPIAMGSEGHEAVQAGTGLAFERGRDLLYPYYRNTGLILACGFPLVDLFRSQFARATARTKGRQIIKHVTARELGIAPETVKSHAKRIFVKLGTKTRAQAVARAVQLGFI